MTTAAYYREWRAAHPAYRARDAARSKRNGHGDRTAEYARRNALRAAIDPVEPLPLPFLGHPVFDAARAIVGRDRSGYTVYLDPLHEDLMSVAVVALVEGSDPDAAVRRFRSSENVWRRITGPLLLEGVAV